MSEADKATEQRLQALEIKMMDLELAWQQLNEVVLAHYQDIERLQRVNQELRRQLDNIGTNNDDSPSAADEVPPHY